MRTVLLGGLVSGLVGAFAGLASWSDISAATTTGGPRLEVTPAAMTVYAEAEPASNEYGSEYAAFRPAVVPASFYSQPAPIEMEPLYEAPPAVDAEGAEEPIAAEEEQRPEPLEPVMEHALSYEAAESGAYEAEPMLVAAY